MSVSVAESLAAAQSAAPPRTARPWWFELGSVLPRSIGFAARASRVTDTDAVPALSPNPLAWATIAIDELMVSGAFLLSRNSAVAATDLHLAEAEAAAERLDAAGVLADPMLWHPAPAPASKLRVSKRTAVMGGFGQVSWESTYEAPIRLAGADRWESVDSNRRAHAFFLRHHDKPRPWLLILHGHRMGEPRDIRLLGGAQLYRELGVNVAQLVLPMHGPRGRDGAIMFPGVDPIANLLGMAQAVSDARALIGWIRTQTDQPIGVHGVSLGGHVSALLASLTDQVAAVVPGVPLVDVASMLGETMRSRWGDEAVEEAHILDPAPRALSAVVSPLSFEPQVPHDRRFIYAAVGDRLVTADQALRLWRHWDRPKMLWLQGGHILNNTRSSRRFLVESMIESGVTGDPERPR
jgi:hypothetical protein